MGRVKGRESGQGRVGNGGGYGWTKRDGRVKGRESGRGTVKGSER